jgi:hypothetical protein
VSTEEEEEEEEVEVCHGDRLRAPYRESPYVSGHVLRVPIDILEVDL